MRSTRLLLGPVLACLLCGASQSSQALDLAQAQVVLAASASPVERQAARMLVEEVEKRSGLTWAVRSASPAAGASRIVLADLSQVGEMLKTQRMSGLALRAKPAAESFAIRVRDEGRTIVVVGADERGVLFGVGYVLRHLDMSLHAVGAHGLGDIDSAPAYAVRGHQLGYRPKNNTFDAWTAAQFEQYIRDLAIFGTNTIEIIPPRSDDDAVSPLYTLQPMPMMVKLSETIARYGLDCSIWYPALDKDYSNPATVDAAVAEWGAVFDQLPRIDAVFVPGGDPGHTEPKYLFGLLERQAARLHQRHPHAKMWVSPQGFTALWMEQFYDLLAKRPAWLTGVVYGPEMRDSLELFRRRVPAQYPIRFYPDITHSTFAQYPVADLDPAFALTEGREPVNPRPQDEGTLFHRYSPLTGGFVAYSEGSNDDVNKILWSGWGWDPKQSADAILTEYAQTFLSSALSEPLVKAIDGLEMDWRGPVRSNASISETLSTLQAVERAQPALVKTNWRFQQLLYRGYYDAYVQQRSHREQAAEAAAIVLLRSKPLTDAGLDEARRALGSPAECGRDRLCERIESLAADLFQSIGMQLSVPKYHALAVGRGANLDSVDAPLSDAPWLGAQIMKAEAEKDPSQRSEIILQALGILGAGGVGDYDILGDASGAPHLLREKSFIEDPSGLQGTYLSLAEGRSTPETAPLAWRTVAGTLYDRPLELLYRDRMPHRSYTIQIRFVSDARRFSVSLDGRRLAPRCDDAACLMASYAVAAEMVPNEEFRLRIAGQQGMGANGRIVSAATVRVSRAD